MTEPKIDGRLRLERLTEDGGFVSGLLADGTGRCLTAVTLSISTWAALESALDENAGLREALEASEAECAKVIEERDEAFERIARWRIELRDKSNDLVNIRGILSPNGGERAVPDDVPTVPDAAPAVEWLVAELGRTRPVVEAAVEWHAAGQSFAANLGTAAALFAAVDSYTQSSNPGETP